MPSATVESEGRHVCCIGFDLLSRGWLAVGAFRRPSGLEYFPRFAHWTAILSLAGLVVAWLTMRYIPNDYVGIVEKLWSPAGCVPEGQIIALDGEAGYQADVAARRPALRLLALAVRRAQGARWSPLPQGKIGYVYARDGEPLPPSQTLGRVVAVQQLSGRPRVLESRRRRGRQLLAASAAGSGRSCAKACTRSTWPLFVVITEDASTRCRRPARRAGAGHDHRRGSDELQEVGRLQPGRHRPPRRGAPIRCDPDADDDGR